MLVEEGDVVGAGLRIAEASEGHLGARRERLGAGQPLAEAVPVPVAALLRQRVGESESLALADRLAEHAPQVRPHLIGAALVGVVTGAALLEDVRALGRVGGREISLNRLFGCGAAGRILFNARDRIAHLLRALAVQRLASDDRGSK